MSLTLQQRLMLLALGTMVVGGVYWGLLPDAGVPGGQRPCIRVPSFQDPNVWDGINVPAIDGGPDGACVAPCAAARLMSRTKILLESIKIWPTTQAANECTNARFMLDFDESFSCGPFDAPPFPKAHELGAIMCGPTPPTVDFKERVPEAVPGMSVSLIYKAATPYVPQSPLGVFNLVNPTNAGFAMHVNECACKDLRPDAGANCRELILPDGGWTPAKARTLYQRGEWAGADCIRAPCGESAAIQGYEGVDYSFPAACKP